MGRQVPCDFCLIQDAIKTGKTQTIKLTAPDGRIYELTSTPFKDIDGKSKVIEIVRDITKLKEIDEKIKESEERFRELFDHMSSGVAIYQAADKGKDFIFKDFNRAAEKIENVKKEVIIGRSVLEVFPGVKDFGLFDVFKRVWKTGKPEHHPIRLYKDNRIAGWKENYVFKLSSGEIVAVYDDVTQRWEAEAKIKESEKRFRKSIMDAPLPIMIHKEDGKVVSINQVWTEITGYTKDEIPTIEAWTKKAFGKKKNLIKDAIDKLYKTNKRSDEGEFEIKTKDGSKRIWHFSSAPLGKSVDGLRLVISMALDVTEQKEREEEYKNLINGMNDTVFVIDFDGKFVEVNDTAVEVLGYSREELLKMGPNDIDPLLEEKEIKQLIKGMKQGEKQVFITAHKTKSGKAIPVEVSSSLVTYQGKPYILSITRDITIRKKTADDLQKSKDQLSLIFNNSSDSLILFAVEEDGTFRIVNANKTAIETVRSLGIEVSKENFIGKTVREISHDFLALNQERFEDLVANFDLAAKSGTLVSYEEIYSFGDKNYYAEVSIVPVLDEKGKGIYALWSSRDISERKRAENALQESEERFETVIENLPDEIFVHGLDGKFILVNKASCEKTGYTKDELLGMEVGVIDHESIDRDDKKNIWLKLQKKGGFERIESTHYRKDGSSYPAEIFFGAVTFKGSPMIIGIAHDITERKKALEGLRKSEEQLSAIFNNTSDLQFLFSLEEDGELRVASVNKTAISTARRLGLDVSKESFLGKTVRNILKYYITPAEKDTEEVYKMFWHTIETGKPVSYEETYSFGNRLYSGEVTVAPVLDENGKCSHVLWSSHDITDRKKAEESLKESEERFQTVVENLPHGAFVHDLDGKIILVNKASTELTGYTKDELLKMRVSDIGRDRKKIWLKLQKEGGFFRGETTFLRKDGTKLPTAIHAGAVTIGEQPMIIAITHDITERKNAVDKLKESEERFQTVIENLPYAVCVHDLDGNFILVNEALCKYTGYTRNDFLNMTVADVDHQSQTRNDRKNIWLKLTKGGHTSFESNLYRKDGSFFPAEIYLSAITLEGNPMILAITYDITERQKTENELRKIERLESLGVLAGGIAHDFNNLLTGILGNLSLAQIKEGEDVKELLEEAKQASIQAKNLTQQLLTFAKGGEPIKGEASIKNIIKLSAGFTLHGSNVKCLHDFQEDLWKVEVDKGQMSQVIDNLVINSTQAMPAGGKIRIKAENFIIEKDSSLPLAQGKYVKITFSDEGTGIPEEHLARIFDPYFTTKQKGSGLGLATVFSVIQRHGGHITVKAEVEKGTTFHIYLPAFIEEKGRRKGKKEADQHLRGKGKILVMDDEETIRNTLNIILKKLGYSVTLTTRGEETLVEYKKALSSEEPFDAVILDLTIAGGMGGKKTMEKLLALDPEVRAIVSSGYSTDPIMANYEGYGFKAVAVKPYDVEELIKSIRKVLE